MKIVIIISIISITALVIACIAFSRTFKNNRERYKKDSITDVHKKLTLKYGDMMGELPEQKVILEYLSPDARVLEFGGNIGRASLIINYVLEDKTQQLTIESDPNIAKQLKENRDLNNAKFEILEGLISNKKFIQQGWRTKQSDKLEAGWKQVANYSLENILEKYNINFDTIVADCESCTVSFFKEYPDFIKQIKLIIIEHDFNDKEDLNYFKNLMAKNNFKKIYTVLKDDPEGPGMSWGDGVSGDPDFVTVWKK